MPLFTYIPLFIGLWIAWKTWSCKEFPVPLRIFLCIFWLVVSQSFPVQSHYFGSLAGPDIDSPLLLLLDAGFCTLLLTFAGAAAWELASLILKGVRRIVCGKKAAEPGQDQGTSQSEGHGKDQPASPSRRQFLAMTAASGMGIIVPAAAVTSGIGVKAAVSAPVLRSWEVHIPNLPASLHDLRIVQLSDLHIGPLWTQAQARNIIEKVNDARPDLVCITGDLADGSPGWRSADGTPRRYVARQFADLKSRFGTYACTGNHEYIGDCYDEWMPVWKECGIHFLHNESVVLQKDKAAVILAGLDDPRAKPGSTSRNPFASAPQNDPAAFRIVMDHRPVRAASNARKGAQLQLSGHTHGGQIAGFDAIVARANKGFVRDWYKVDNMLMYVSSGTSQWSGFAVRLGVPAEIALITLKKGPAQIVLNKKC